MSQVTFLNGRGLCRGGIYHVLLSYARRAARGFTVIEGLVALVVLMISMMAIIEVVPDAFRYTARDSERTQALSAAQEYLDMLRHYIMTFGNDSLLPVPPGISIDPGEDMQGDQNVNVSPGNFTITSNSCPPALGSTIRYDCIVTVTWTQYDEIRSVTVESYVTSQKS